METCSNGIDIETVKITTSAISTAANLFCVAESSVGFIIIGDSHHIEGVEILTYADNSRAKQAFL
jgi:hypothetical protein